jgi:hypothetical protein
MARTLCVDSSFFTGRCSLRIIEEVLQYFHGLGRVFFVHQQLHHIHSWVGVRRKLARQHTGYFFASRMLLASSASMCAVGPLNVRTLTNLNFDSLASLSGGALGRSAR